jgi:hypothetical protein
MFQIIFSMIAFVGLSAAANASNFSNNILLENESLHFQALTTANYYDQFLFRVEGDCKDGNDRIPVWFYSAGSWETAKIGNDNQGRPVEAKLLVQLFKDGTYWAAYSEDALKEIARDVVYDILFYKEGLQGNWKVNGTQIELSGLGTGVQAKVTDSGSGKQYDSFKFTLTTKINDPRAVNAVMNISRNSTNLGPKGISINQYCGVD